MVYFFYFFLTCPFCYWVYLGLVENLGAEPMVTLSIQSGYLTLGLLLVNLWIGVAVQVFRKKLKNLSWVLQRRRSLGIATGIYALLHFLTYLGKESFESIVWEQIVTKFYLSVSFIALLILTVMLLTSNHLSLKKLGVQKWKSIHRFVHLASALILIHVLFIEKANIPLLVAMTVPLIPFQIWRFARFYSIKWLGDRA